MLHNMIYTHDVKGVYSWQEKSMFMLEKFLIYAEDATKFIQ
jgi:hypothetical protein